MANKWTLTEQQKAVDTYLKGCVNLYGYVTPRQFLKVYNRYNTPKIKKEDLLKWGYKLERHSYDSYTIYTNAIVCSRVGKEKLNQICYFQEGKKYYMPSEQEILAYSNDDYYEKTEYTEKLYQFLTQRIKLSIFASNSFISKLVWLIRTEEPISVQCGLFEPYEIEPKDMNEANQLLKIMKDLNNNSRKWANCGYTPKELFEEYHKNNT